MFYLYLVPRGLRIILPILKDIGRPIRVITYMAPFPESEEPVRCIKCTSDAHPERGEAHPLYLYHLNFPSDVDAESVETITNGSSSSRS